MENNNARKNAQARKNRQAKKIKKPSTFVYNPELSEEANKEIELLYKQIEDNNKLINEMLK